ncbi:MAG: flagellar basal body rod protein FlgF [Pseudomonadales bacterium]|nr:flagellar basal body rod protein FlgF [Pseudomonadales bacterium]
MDHIIYTAMSGARQTMEEQGVLSHNLANVATTGFRAQLSAQRAVPVQGAGNLPTRTVVASTTPGADFSPGPLHSTGRELDIALQGEAWLAVQSPDGSEAYTRRGDLTIDSNGLLFSGGHPVVGDGGPILLPLDSEVFVGGDGTLSAIGSGEDADTLAEVARLKMVTPGAEVLLRGDDGLFRLPLDGNGQPRALAQDDTARLFSGVLESSNVSAIGSMVAMIGNARRYEMQLNTIQSADENAERANTLLSDQS